MHYTLYPNITCVETFKTKVALVFCLFSSLLAVPGGILGVIEMMYRHNEMCINLLSLPFIKMIPCLSSLTSVKYNNTMFIHLT